MGFNNSAFMKQQYEPRTAIVATPALSDFFGDENPEFKVRGQTASELARTMEESSKQKNLDSVIQAIGNNQDQVNELKKAIGISDEVPADIVKRINQLVTCSVEPEIDQMCAVKLAETFPIEFYLLTNKITELTGQGMQVALKKPQNSGETMK